MLLAPKDGGLFLDFERLETSKPLVFERLKYFERLKMAKFALCKDLDVLRSKLNASKPLFLDTETTCLYKNMTLCQLMQEGWEVPLLYCVANNKPRLQELYSIIKDAHVVCHNYSFDGEVFRNDLNLDSNPFKRFDCTLLLAKLLLFRELEGYSLDNCLRLVNGFDAYRENAIDKKEMQKLFMKLENEAMIESNYKALQYASFDVLYMPKFWNYLCEKRKELKSEGIDITYVLELDKKFIDYALFWSQRGLPFDKEALKSKKLKIEKELETQLGYLPKDLNVNSPKQVKTYMQGTLKLFAQSYDELNLKIAWYDHGSQESYSIMKSRKLIKSLDFIDRFSSENSRIRGYFQPLTVSGRVMCSGAKDDKSDNIMQIPRDFHSLVGFKSINKEEGLLNEDDKRYLVYADYAQLELRCLCCVTGDETLDRLFREGKDLHKYAATKIYQIDESKVTSEQRTMAKFSNFSLSYGSSSKNFQQILYKMGDRKPPNEAECARIVKAWKSAYPRVKEWQDKTKDAFFKGYDEYQTPNGRPYKAKMYTDLLAIQVQGLGAEVSKLALHYLFKNWHKDFQNDETIAPLDFHLLNFIHDSMIIEAKGLSMAKKVSKALADSMVKSWHASIANLKINDLPMPTDASVIENWDENEAVFVYTNEGFPLGEGVRKAKTGRKDG